MKIETPSTLLVGMQNGAAAIENRPVVPQKLIIQLPYAPAISVLGMNRRVEIRTQILACKCSLQHYKQ